jgi:hypothetical protein
MPQTLKNDKSVENGKPPIGIPHGSDTKRLESNRENNIFLSTSRYKITTYNFHIEHKPIIDANESN